MKCLSFFLSISLFSLISCTSVPTEDVSNNSHLNIYTNPHKPSYIGDPNSDEEQLRQEMLRLRELSKHGYVVS